MSDHPQDPKAALDALKSKAQKAVGDFMDDQERVDQVKAKAEGVLARKLGEEKAEKAVSKTEKMLRRFAKREEPKP